MLDILCALPLSSEVFTQALHPTEPLLSVGLATGHVQTYRLPTDDDKNAAATTSGTSSDDDTAKTSSRPRRSSLSSNASPTPLITTSWRTRRHHGSCRALAFSAVDGRYLFSAGTDGLVKLADTDTGRVVAKIAVPEVPSSRSPLDFPCAIHPLTPEAFLLATDSGKVHLYDTRTNSKAAPSPSSLLSRKPVRSWSPHVAGECVSSFVSVPPSETSTSGLPRAFITTGGGGVALTDIRKGDVVGSSLEAPEPVNAAAVSHPSGYLVVGDAAGGVWSMDRSVVARWEDGLGRHRVDVKRTITSPEGDVLDVSGAIDTEAGIEVMCAVPEGDVSNTIGKDAVVLGWDTGRVEIASLHGKGGKGGSSAGAGRGAGWATRGTVVLDLPPDAEGEGIVGLGFDSTGRLVVGAGQKIVIYEHGSNGVSAGSSAHGLEDDSDNGDDDADAMNGIIITSATKPGNGKNKRPAENGASDDDDEENVNDEDDSGEEGENSSDDDDEEQKRRKKHKKKKRKGKQQKNHASFNFAGLD